MKWMVFFSDWLGRTEFFGIDLGFWAGMCAVVLMVLVMNLIVWSRKPKKE